jgi:hypothetical protein
VSYKDASADVTDVKIGLPWAAPIIEAMNSLFVDFMAVVDLGESDCHRPSQLLP